MSTTTPSTTSTTCESLHRSYTKGGGFSWQYLKLWYAGPKTTLGGDLISSYIVRTLAVKQTHALSVQTGYYVILVLLFLIRGYYI
jgi:hypothetical protein